MVASKMLGMLFKDVCRMFIKFIYNLWNCQYYYFPRSLIFAIVNKGTGMLKKLSNYHHSLVTLYKTFIRPHLDYADIIYDKSKNMNISNKIENL